MAIASIDEDFEPVLEGTPLPASPIFSMALSTLRHRRMIVIMALVGFGLVVGITLLRPRMYTASGAFIPKGRSSTSNLAGLAMQLGVSLPTAEAGQSPAFYADLINTREVLGRVANARFLASPNGANAGRTLADIFEVQQPDSAKRRAEVIRRLRSAIHTDVAQKTGVITLAVTTRFAALSREVAATLLSELDRYNLERRQSQATAERRFAELQFGQARTDLRKAEDQLEEFLRQNRRYDSPELTFQHDRLVREVELRQQLFGALAEAYEQAKLEEVRDTPVITVVDPPEQPARPDPRGLLVRAILGLAGGVFLGFVVAFLRDHLTTAASTDTERREFEAMRRAAFDDLALPARIGRRLFQRPEHTDAAV